MRPLPRTRRGRRPAEGGAGRPGRRHLLDRRRPATTPAWCCRASPSSRRRKRKRLPIGDVTLEGVTEDEWRLRHRHRLDRAPFEHSKDGVTLDLSPFVIHDMTIPADGATGPLALADDVRSRRTRQHDGQGRRQDRLLDGRACHSRSRRPRTARRWSSPAPPKSSRPTSRWSRIRKSKDVDRRARLPEHHRAISRWPAPGSRPTARWSCRKYDISVDNAGTLGMTFDLGGYTLDFIKSLQEMQKKMAAQPEGADNSAQGMAMLGLMQQLTLQQRLDPLRRQFADQQGAGLCRQAAGHVGQGHRQPGQGDRAVRAWRSSTIPELTAQVTAAVSNYPRRSEEPRDLGRAAGSRCRSR